MFDGRPIVRGLLKVVDRYVTTANGNKLWRRYILDQMHKSRDLNNETKAKHLVACAVEYTDLVQSVHSHKRLLESYDITTDKDAQQRKLVEKTAKRVGFKLPKYPTDRDREQNNSANA